MLTSPFRISAARDSAITPIRSLRMMKSLSLIYSAATTRDTLALRKLYILLSRSLYFPKQPPHQVFNECPITCRGI